MTRSTVRRARAHSRGLTLSPYCFSRRRRMISKLIGSPPRMLVSVLESHAPGDEGGVSEIRARRRARHEPLRDAVADGEELHEIPRNAASLSRIKHRMDYLPSQPDPLHDRWRSCERRVCSSWKSSILPILLIEDTLRCLAVPEQKSDKPYRRYVRMCARVTVKYPRRIYDGAGDTGERLR
jgi:hypothetical protein